MKAIKLLVDLFFVRSGNIAWHYELLNVWHQAVGALGKQMYLARIEGDCVWIGVYDPRWMHELYMLSHTITCSINAALNAEHVRHVKFFLHREKKNGEKRLVIASRAPMSLSVSPSVCAPVVARELSEIECRALELIADESLRASLLKLFYQRTY